MAKLDYERNYYADLELPGTADAVEVKKQFKKLALKWHPDRNPGKEDEAKEKFLVIQAAHEILTDPVTKSKFDAYRQRTNRYPAASGVRGNPWQHTAQDVNQKFGAPPKRPPMPARPTAPTGSTRYWDWAQKAKGKTENPRANMEAWDRSRPQPKQPQPSAAAAASAARPGTRPTNPQTAPRSAAQARRQEAAFGTRRTGFAPTSPIGDEPPVRNQNYNNSTRESAPQASKPRPASAFVDPLTHQFGEAYLDNRQRAPYASNNVGEKTNPFEPLNVNRAKSMRDAGRRFQGDAAEAPPQPPPRQRSASVGSENFQRSTNENQPYNEPSAKPAYQQQSRASARYSPRGAEPNSASPTATFPGPHSSTSSVNSSAGATVNGDASANPRNGTKVYESPDSYTYYRNLMRTPYPGKSFQTPHSNSRVGYGFPRAQESLFPAYMPEERISAPSGERPNLFERGLHAQLQHLLSGARTQPFGPHVPAASNSALPSKTIHPSKYTTNTNHPASFSVPLDDDPTSPAQQARFTRNSADNINTRFVAEEKGGSNFRFSAGAPPSPEDGFLRAKHRARGHQSPLRNEFASSTESFPSAPQQSGTSKQPGDFVADEWKEAFGPHVFEPPQPGRPSASPTRPIRPIKKTRPVRMTAGTAGIVDDEDTSGEERPKPAAAPGGIDGTRSPNAMDIDPPPPGPAIPPTTGARNINVEPTKPEWRAGSGVHAEPKLGAGLKIPGGLNPTAAGSEDSEEFMRPMFPEFRNVEPFAPKPSAGLSSFADLASNLPFASRPSAKLSLAHEKPKQLDIPTPPTAPRPPAGLVVPGTKLSAPAWTSYVREFEAYLARWFEFNKKVTDHFAARQKVNENRGLTWVNAQGDGGVSEYLRSLEEDKYVRQKWMAACEAHECHYREFLAGRERVVRQ